VPESDLDTTHGLDCGPMPTEENRPLVHPMNQAFDFEGILTENALSETAADFVREGSLDDRTSYMGRGIHFADPNDSFVRVNLDHQRFLTAIATFVDIGKTKMDGFDFGVLHGGI